MLIHYDGVFKFLGRRGHHLDIAATDAVFSFNFVSIFGSYLSWLFEFLFVDILSYFAACFFSFPLFALLGSLVELLAQFGVLNRFLVSVNHCNATKIFLNYD